jgi:hypothetical protein
MSYREIHYSWEYDLKSTPEQLWPFVADTNRFNRDTGVPSIQPAAGKKQRLRNARRKLKLSFLGFPVEWEEQPFEWVRPLRFGVRRNYSKGPVAELRALAELKPLDKGGTKVSYQIWLTPKTIIGAFVVPLQIRWLTSRRFDRAFRKYDEIASNQSALIVNQANAELPPGSASRLASAKQKLRAEEPNFEVIERLVSFVQNADDFTVSRIRPYELADAWKESRLEVLRACLRATRSGLLDLQWELLCPLCRGANETASSLRDINAKVHCETCRIDFTANFDRFVEVTFRPNAAIRHVENKQFCIGSPQRTPHVVAQQLLPPGAARVLTLPLETGNYRLRVLELSGEQPVAVSEKGMTSGQVVVEENWGTNELHLARQSSLEL